MVAVTAQNSTFFFFFFFFFFAVFFWFCFFFLSCIPILVHTIGTRYNESNCTGHIAHQTVVRVGHFLAASLTFASSFRLVPMNSPSAFLTVARCLCALRRDGNLGGAGAGNLSTPFAAVTLGRPARRQFSFAALRSASEHHTRATPAAAAAAAASLRAGAAEPIVVSKFTALLPLVKRLVLRIHPDVVTAYGPDVVTVNESSLQELFTLLDIVKTRSALDPRGADPLKVPPRTQPLQPRYHFSFYYRGSGGTGTRGIGGSGGDAHPELRRTNHVIAVDPLFESRVSVLAERGQPETARAHWLSFAIDALRKLLSGVGLSADAHRLTLDASLRSLLASSSSGAGSSSSGDRRSPRQRRYPTAAEQDSAYSALRENLREMSPLEQGKGGDSSSGIAVVGGAGVGQRSPAVAAGVRGGSSVFSARARSDRALSILASTDRMSTSPDVSPEEARVAMATLRSAMVDRHDELRLYHPLWLMLNVRLESSSSPSRWSVQTRSLTVHVPVDATADDLVHFILRVWSGLTAAVRAGSTVSLRRTGVDTSFTDKQHARGHQRQ